MKGSVYWLAPELITDIVYTTKADIWSFGCTILEMATAKVPWSQFNFDNPLTAILKIGSITEIPHIPDDLPENLYSIIKICLNRDPDKRPTAE